MQKKGKEFDLGRIRIQVDPAVLAHRLIMRQKLFLTTVAIIGGIATVTWYKLTPKTYSAQADVAIRTEALQEGYVRNLLNSAVRELNSGEQLMLLMNELDLYPSTRAKAPYEMAIRRINGDLEINRRAGIISVRFKSKSPIETYNVVAFATERVLGAISDLLDAPIASSLDAVDRSIRDLEPKLETAQTDLFDFQARHPEIAIRIPAFMRTSSGLTEVEEDIQRAGQDLKRCFAGYTTLRSRQSTPSCRRAQQLKKERRVLLRRFTPSHPSMRQKATEIAEAQMTCERDRSSGDLQPGTSPSHCQEAIAARMKRLHRKKAEMLKKRIRKPSLQKTWAKLSSEAEHYETQLRALKERRARTVGDRLLKANNFQENFQLVNAPRVPQLPSAPSSSRFMFAGMIATAIIGLGLALIREALRQTYLDPQEFEEQTGLQVLAVLPDISDSR